MLGYLIMGLAAIFSIVIAISFLVNDDGDDTNDGGFDPHDG